MPARQQSVRIIGGKWRRRVIRFPAVPGLRPTPDRVRETLFNWLAPYIQGADCLDLFAGSGVLALEALSRGARNVVALDAHPEAIDALRANAAAIGTSGLDPRLGDALEFLRWPGGRRFDIVFVDPPFDGDWYAQIGRLLRAGAWLSSRGLVYMESPRETRWAGGPDWRVLRDKTAGRVRYRLLESSDGGDDP